MQRHIEVLEDGYINTYQVYINDQDTFNKYRNELKTLSTNHIRQVNCSLDSLHLKYILEYLISTGCEITKLESDKSVSYTFLPNMYDIYYKKYPLLYDILTNIENDMFYYLYIYINNLDIEDSIYWFNKNNDESYDNNISIDDKKKYIRNILELLSFKKIDCRLAHNLEEYNKIQEKTNVATKLIDSLYQNNKVKTNKK